MRYQLCSTVIPAEIRKEGRKEGIGFTPLSTAWVIWRTRNQEKIAFSSRLLPGGCLVAEGPEPALHNAAHVYSEQADPRIGIQRTLEPANSRKLGSQAS